MRRRGFLHGIGVAGAALGLPRYGTALEGRPAPAIRGAVRPSAPRRPARPTLAASLQEVGAALGLRVTKFEGSNLVANADVPFPISPRAGSTKLLLSNTIIACHTQALPARNRRDATDLEVTFRMVRGRLPNANVAVTLHLANWSRESYLLVPGAVYGGNRFASRHIQFPPLATEPSDIGPHVPPIVSDIPRLNSQPGESRIVLTAADAAMPAIGARVVMPPGDRPSGSEHGFVLMGDPTTELGLAGLSVVENADRSAATLSISAPGVRTSVRYGLCNTRVPSNDRGADLDTGWTMTLRLRLLSFACPAVGTLFERWYEARRDRLGPAKILHDLPLSAAHQLVRERVSADQWTEAPGIFSTRSPTVLATERPPRPLLESTFRTGADGALALALPLVSPGGAEARKRAAAVIDFQLRGQAASGLFRAASNGAIWWDEGDSPSVETEVRGALLAASKGRAVGRVADPRASRGRKWIHVGRNAEALYLACKEVLFLKKMDSKYQPPERWRIGLGRAADAFVRQWTRHKQFGQYANCDTGDVTVGGSAAGALAPAALVLAARVLKTDDYQRCALESAEAFHSKFVSLGWTLGGAPAALQSPDSRSAAGLLESFVTLGEATGDAAWFARAAEVAHQLATWIVAWDIPFPETSTLGKLGARTTGAVLASAQDKWASPGFAGLSGDALFRLYRASGQVSYLELLRETVHNSSGYVDREDRRPDVDSRPGWVAGRITVNDSLGSPGDVPAGTPAGAAQATCLLSPLEVPSIYAQPDSGFVFVFDHVDVRVKRRTGNQMTVAIHNPTRFEAELRIFTEGDGERSRPWEMFALWGARSLTLAAGATEELDLSVTPG